VNDAGASATEGAPGLRCDFCDKHVPRVRRVALDRDYERLQTPHAVQYACPDCSAEKERQRSAVQGD
jgi:hypothetical protein